MATADEILRRVEDELRGRGYVIHTEVPYAHTWLGRFLASETKPDSEEIAQRQQKERDALAEAGRSELADATIRHMRYLIGAHNNPETRTPWLERNYEGSIRMAIGALRRLDYDSLSLEQQSVVDDFEDKVAPDICKLC